MAINLVGSVQYDANSLTGFASGNLDGELSYEGSGSVGGKAGSGITRYFNTGTSRNFNVGGANEGDHVVSIIGSLTPGKLDTKANGGIRPSWGNSSTVYNEAYVDGSDTKPTTTLFLPYIYDPTAAPDNSAGTVSLAAVDTFGFTASATSGIMGNFNNFLGDQCTIGKGLEGTGTGGTLQEWIDADEGTLTNRWGFLTTREGVVYMQGKMYFGTSAASYTFSDSDKIIVFPDVPVASDFFEIICDNAGSNVTFDGFAIQAPGTPKVALTYSDGTWSIENSTIDGASPVTMGAGMSLNQTKLVNSGVVSQNGGTITGGSIINGIGSAGLVMDDYSKVSNLTLSGHTTALDATAAIVADAVELDSIQFSGNTTDVTVNSPNDITIKNLNGSNVATATNTGAGNATIETSVQVVAEGIVSGSRLAIAATATVGSVTAGDVLVNEIVTADPFIYTHNFEGDLSVEIKVRNATTAPFYSPFETTGTIRNTGLPLVVKQELD